MLHTVARSSVGRSVGRAVGYNRRRGEQESGNAASYLPCRWRCYPLWSAPSPPSSYRCNSSEFGEEEQSDGNRIGWVIKEGPRSHCGHEG